MCLCLVSLVFLLGDLEKSASMLITAVCLSGCHYLAKLISPSMFIGPVCLSVCFFVCYLAKFHFAKYVDRSGLFVHLFVLLCVCYLAKCHFAKYVDRSGLFVRPLICLLLAKKSSIFAKYVGQLRLSFCLSVCLCVCRLAILRLHLQPDIAENTHTYCLGSHSVTANFLCNSIHAWLRGKVKHRNHINSHISAQKNDRDF